MTHHTQPTTDTLITPQLFRSYPWPAPSAALCHRLMAEVRRSKVQPLPLPFGLTGRGAGLFLSTLLLIGFLSGTLVGLNTQAQRVTPTTAQGFSYHSTGAALMTQLYSAAGDAP